MLKKYFFLVLVLVFSTALFSQEVEKKEFKPSGSPIVRVFFNYHTDFKNVAVAEIRRAYLGYKYKVSEKYSLKLVYDVGNPLDGGKLDNTAYLKIAQLQYNHKKLQWRVGMIPTKSFKYQEHWWGYRYLQKSFQDKYKFNSSADIGASFEYRIIDEIRIEGIVQNGEGYKKIQKDATFRGGAGVTYEPRKNVRLRVYYDNSTRPDVQLQTIATYFGYDFKDILSFGAEYNKQVGFRMKNGKDLSGASAYLTYFINKKFQVFGRYDYTMSNKLEGELEVWNYIADGNYYIGGVQMKLVKGVKMSVNYQGFQSPNTDKDLTSMMFVSFEYKLK